LDLTGSTKISYSTLFLGEFQLLPMPTTHIRNISVNIICPPVFVSDFLVVAIQDTEMANDVGLLKEV
jgi:hypothetical protein